MLLPAIHGTCDSAPAAWADIANVVFTLKVVANRTAEHSHVGCAVLAYRGLVELPAIVGRRVLVAKALLPLVATQIPIAAADVMRALPANLAAHSSSLQ